VFLAASLDQGVRLARDLILLSPEGAPSTAFASRP
jgi:hypothetical protein